MVNEVRSALLLDRRGTYIDATYGRGGHSKVILDSLKAEGKLFAIDCDAEAIEHANRHLGHDKRFEAIHTRFSEIHTAITSRVPSSSVSGIVADLGVSSPQLDLAKRGFSFTRSGPLDMRFDPTDGQSAADWLNHVKEDDLANTLKTLGNERYARKISKAVLRRRQDAPITTTTELAELVERSVPTREQEKHPATRTFLALRIHINRELDELANFLPQCIELLKLGGRLVVITFHSLEDRIVRNFMRDAAIGAPGPVNIPFRNREFKPTLKVIGKALRAEQQEIDTNIRARSATMRVAERIGVEYA